MLLLGNNTNCSVLHVPLVVAQDIDETISDGRANKPQEYEGHPLMLAELYYMSKYFMFNLSPASKSIVTGQCAQCAQCAHPCTIPNHTMPYHTLPYIVPHVRTRSRPTGTQQGASVYNEMLIGVDYTSAVIFFYFTCANQGSVCVRRVCSHL